MAMSTKPSASSPRLGFINAQTSGRFFHAFLRFSLLAGDLTAVSVAMIGRRTILHEFDASSVRMRSEEHTSELQSQSNLVCRLLLEKKNQSLSRLPVLGFIARVYALTSSIH